MEYVVQHNALANGVKFTIIFNFISATCIHKCPRCVPHLLCIHTLPSSAQQGWLFLSNIILLQTASNLLSHLIYIYMYIYIYIYYIITSPLCSTPLMNPYFAFTSCAGSIFSIRWGSILVLFLNLALVRRSPSCSDTSQINTSQSIKICQIYMSKFIIFQ